MLRIVSKAKLITWFVNWQLFITFDMASFAFAVLLFLLFLIFYFTYFESAAGTHINIAVTETYFSCGDTSISAGLKC